MSVAACVDEVGVEGGGYGVGSGVLCDFVLDACCSGCVGYDVVCVGVALYCEVYCFSLEGFVVVSWCCVG